MRQALACTPDRTGGIVPPFKAVLLYEDLVTRMKAKQITASAINRLGPVCTFNTALWSIEQAEIAALNAVSASESTDADIAIISLRDGHGLSSSLRMWVNQWLVRKKGTRAAMVVLFEDAGSATDFARRHLGNTARRAGVKFFTQTGDIEGEGNSKTQTGKISIAV